MAFKMPRLGYLTYAELKERWSCTDNQLRTAIICGDIVPAVFVDGVLMIPEWRNDNFRGWIADKPAEVKKGVAIDLPPVDVPIRSGSPGSRLLDGYVG